MGNARGVGIETRAAESHLTISAGVGAADGQIRFDRSGRKDWGGILITSSKGTSELVWCIFSNAEVAVRVNDGKSALRIVDDGGKLVD